MDYLCLIATDGKMSMTIPATDTMVQYDAVTVTVGEDEQEGYITKIGDGTATVVFDDNYYPVGTSATVLDENGNTLGSGAMTVNEFVEVTASSGKIAAVKGTITTRSAGSNHIYSCRRRTHSTYTALKKTEAELLDQIADLEALLTVTADTDCTLTSLSVAAGDQVSAGTTVCVLTGTDGFTLALSIDELDIASVALDQNATLTLDALDGEFSGKVTNISYSGSGSYVTSYHGDHYETEPIEGAYPGMSASVEVVNLDERRYADRTRFGGTVLWRNWRTLPRRRRCAGRDSLDETSLDLDKLTKVTVTTGMSDGSYIAITADGLAAGDVVWVPEAHEHRDYRKIRIPRPPTAWAARVV
jgi:multidrug efflux pump subunit AcrA (membrane-fusion protein)